MTLSDDIRRNHDLLLDAYYAFVVHRKVSFVEFMSLVSMHTIPFTDAQLRVELETIIANARKPRT